MPLYPGDTSYLSLEHGLPGALHGSFLDVRGLKIGYRTSATPGEQIVYALSRDDSRQWLPIKRRALYKIAVNDYTFKGGRGYRLFAATRCAIFRQKLVFCFAQLSLKHKYVKPHYGNRIRSLIPPMQPAENHFPHSVKMERIFVYQRDIQIHRKERSSFRQLFNKCNNKRRYTQMKKELIANLHKQFESIVNIMPDS